VAGFQVILSGRFWVITEGVAEANDLESKLELDEPPRVVSRRSH
jgi:hypothetical protein